MNMMKFLWISDKSLYRSPFKINYMKILTISWKFVPQTDFILTKSRAFLVMLLYNKWIPI